MTKKPTDKQIRDRAIELLEDGLLISELPAMLMKEFKLTRGRAWKMASEVIKQINLPQGRQ